MNTPIIKLNASCALDAGMTRDEVRSWLVSEDGGFFFIAEKAMIKRLSGKVRVSIKVGSRRRLIPVRIRPDGFPV